MRTYVVKKGDYLARIAFEHGVAPDDIWNHDKNKDLKTKRANPNVLAPGDLLFLPDPPARTEFDLAIGGNNRYQANVRKTRVKIALHDAEGGAMSGTAYEVHGAGPEPLTGSTDGAGLVDVEVPVTVQRIVVKLPDKHRLLRFDIGHIDPVETPTGVAARLDNLGYLQQAFSQVLAELKSRGALKGRLARTDPLVVERGLRLFQRAKQLTETGRVDDDTRRALGDDHQC